MARKQKRLESQKPTPKAENRSLSSIRYNKFLKDNMVLLIILALVIGLGGVFALTSPTQKVGTENLAYGDDVIEMHFFHLTTCPHCVEQIKFHKTLLEEYPNVKIIEHDLSLSENQKTYEEMIKNFPEIDSARVATPTSIIGDRINVGFGTPETSGKVLEEMVEEVQKKIDQNWQEGMIRTIELRASQGEDEER